MARELTKSEREFLSGKTGLDIYDRAIEFGNFHVFEWMAEYAQKNTEGENDNQTERV